MAGYLVIGRSINHYAIIEKLGEGGMGVVYKAHDSHLHRSVALKVLPPEKVADPERKRRFVQEARAASALNHPNIVTVHDIDQSDGLDFIAMEYVEGKTLDEGIGRRGLKLDEALRYAIQIADALAKAHAAGIVHRDLKPGNVMVTEDGRVKVLDFGLAKLTETTAGPEDETHTERQSTELGVIVGTASYMSPEQAEGKKVDARSDIFSFGSLLYEMLTGRRAFRGDTPALTLAAILKEEPPALSTIAKDISPELERIIARCLRKDPNRRFQHMDDVKIALEELQEESTSRKLTTSEVRPLGQPRKQWPSAAALACAALLAVALVMLAYLFASRTSSSHASTYTQITFRRGFLQNARFGPDGEMVLHSGEWQGSPNELFQGRFDSPFSRPVGLTDATIAAVSSTGELAVIMGCQRYFFWFCRGTLARVPLTGGSPRPILDNTAYADWSPDGKNLAVVRYSPGEYRLEYPIGKVLYRASYWLASPRFSPRGDRIAFIEHPMGGDDGWISVADLQGNVKVLSAGWNGIWGLAWSPTGDEVWFAACKWGVSEPDSLYATTLSGRVRTVASYPGTVRLHDISAKGRVLLSKESWRGELHGFFRGSDRDRDLSWLDWSFVSDISPDGTQVLFGGGATGGVAGVSYLRKADGSPAVLLGEGIGPTFSPDLKWVAFFTTVTTASLNLLPTGGGESRTLERGSIEQYQAVGWHPDGKQLLFVGRRKGEGPRLFRQNISGGPPVAALPASFTIRSICVSPDGRFIVAEGVGGKLYRAPLEGGEAVPLPGLTADDIPLLWSADGRSLYVSRMRELPARVYRVAVASGEKQLWKEVAPTDRTGVFSIMTIAISGDERSYAYSFARALSELFVAEGLR
ncbi:MAG: protein kinase [Terriglobales bacterium]